MISSSTAFRAVVGLMLLSVGTVQPFPVAASDLATDRCFSDWSEAGPVARAHKLMPVARVLQLPRLAEWGKVIKVKLCRDGATFAYQVAVASAGGGVRWLAIDARTGAIRALASP